MADFRKWFLVLAVLAAMAVPAAAQTCQASPGSTPFIRANGLTELVGDILLTCTGAATTQTANFQVFVSQTTITNRVSSSTNATACPTGIECVTDALAIVTNEGGTPLVQVNQPAPSSLAGKVVGLLQSNLAAGDAPESRNAILFPSITIPGGTVTKIRITNIRVVAPPVVSFGLPSQVFAFISTNPSTITIDNATLPIANSALGLQFTARNATDTGAASLSFSQCLDQNTGVLSGDKTGPITFLAKFTEGFPSAFKSQAQETGTLTTTDGTVDGDPLLSIGSIEAPTGGADSGTGLMVRFSNIPAGVRIFVTTTPVAAGTSAGITAAISSPGSSAATATIGGVTARQVSISNNVGSARWNVTSNVAGATAQKSIAFGVAVAFVSNTSAGSPGLTLDAPGAVAGLFAPVSTVAFASSSSDDDDSALCRRSAERLGIQHRSLRDEPAVPVRQQPSGL